jgi:hypothetical protein
MELQSSGPFLTLYLKLRERMLPPSSVNPRKVLALHHEQERLLNVFDDACASF